MEGAGWGFGSPNISRSPVTAAFRCGARLAAGRQAMQPCRQDLDDVSVVCRLLFERVQPLAMALFACMRAAFITT